MFSVRSALSALGALGALSAQSLRPSSLACSSVLGALSAQCSVTTDRASADCDLCAVSVAASAMGDSMDTEEGGPEQVRIQGSTPGPEGETQ